MASPGSARWTQRSPTAQPAGTQVVTRSAGLAPTSVCSSLQPHGQPPERGTGGIRGSVDGPGPTSGARLHSRPPPPRVGASAATIG
ncbi:MAG: hypothetical protein CVU56_23005 [Deltaproteobacteria bacterium HGW-Deltaproteobacteria-14]|nr:MAG: hypothetical protein CVU56_23005 [Deltaproteobacteria bacterium HGW-Deltaproteobacteria-14]